jgi:hypothetical protein
VNFINHFGVRVLIEMLFRTKSVLKANASMHIHQRIMLSALTARSG